MLGVRWNFHTKESYQDVKQCLMSCCFKLAGMYFLLLDKVAPGYKPSCGSGFEGDVWSSTLWKWQQYSEAGTTNFTQCQIHFLQGSSPKGCNLWWTLAFREASRQVSLFMIWFMSGVRMVIQLLKKYWFSETLIDTCYSLLMHFQRGFEVARWKDVFWHVQEWLGRWVSTLWT